MIKLILIIIAIIKMIILIIIIIAIIIINKNVDCTCLSVWRTFEYSLQPFVSYQGKFK